MNLDPGVHPFRLLGVQCLDLLFQFSRTLREELAFCGIFQTPGMPVSLFVLQIQRCGVISQELPGLQRSPTKFFRPFFRVRLRLQ